MAIHRLPRHRMHALAVHLVTTPLLVQTVVSLARLISLRTRELPVVFPRKDKTVSQARSRPRALITRRARRAQQVPTQHRPAPRAARAVQPGPSEHPQTHRQQVATTAQPGTTLRHWDRNVALRAPLVWPLLQGRPAAQPQPLGRAACPVRTPPAAVLTPLARRAPPGPTLRGPAQRAARAAPPERPLPTRKRPHPVTATAATPALTQQAAGRATACHARRV